MLDARYDDPRYLLPTVDSLGRVTAVDIDRVVQDRFGDASDWSFAFSGDLDVDEMTDLARRYLGTLPGSGRVEEPTFVEPPPPAGVVDVDAIGGSGSQANLSFLFTAPASTDRLDDVAAMVVSELITARLTDVIREELGESYSPYAMVEVAGRSDAERRDVHLDEYRRGAAGRRPCGDPRRAGRSAGERPDRDRVRRRRRESVRQQLDLIYNEQINDEVLSVLTDPAGNPDFMDFVEQYFLVDELDAATVADYLAAWLPADQFISVTVTPR